MYRVINSKVGSTIESNMEYDDAIVLMHELNIKNGLKMIARGWYLKVEREVYQDDAGHIVYGQFIVENDK